MQETIKKLEKVMADYSPRLLMIGETDFAYKTTPGKWSKKEILGHLIDSAQNNIRRFIVSQYEETPFIIYDQDKWVMISNYQDYAIADLIALWNLLNKHICRILSNTAATAASRLCEVNNSVKRSIGWLAEDYIRHLLHHLHQLLDLEPVLYP